MKKWIKRILAIITGFVLLAVIALILLITCVNPNRFKPLIISQVMKSTGRQLTIDGDLSWRIFPYFGIKVGHMSLSNPAGFQQKTFAEIESAAVDVKLFPLFYSQIESSGIELNGLTLNLIRNAKGQTNWQMGETLPPPTNKTLMTTTSVAAKGTLAIAIKALKIQEATIHWIDEQNNQRVMVDHFNFTANKIRFYKMFPIEMAFHFKKENPAIEGNVKLKADALFNFSQSLYAFKNAALTTTLIQNQKHYEITSQATLRIDMERQQLTLSEWTGTLDKVQFKGALDINQLTVAPVIKGNLSFSPFEGQALYAALHLPLEGMPTFTLSKADFHYSFDTKKGNVSALQKLNVTGSLRGSHLVLQKIKVNDVALDLQFQNGLLNIMPFSGSFYSGALTGKAIVDFNRTVPAIALHTELSNVELEPLMKDLASNASLQFKAVGALKLQVTTAGWTKDALLKGLNGSAQFQLNQGAVEGIDIDYWIDNALAMAAAKPFAGKNTRETPFGKLTGTAVIRSGVVNNNDLLLSGPRFDSKGRGNIDLVNQQINYSLGTTLKQHGGENKNDLLNLYGLTIPILITGSLDHPTIQLDAGELMKQVARQQIQKQTDKIKDQLQDQINQQGKALLNNLLGK